MTVGITELPPEGMLLPGVALAGDADRGTKTTEGISLLFTIAGITVQGPQPQIERLLVWTALDSATCREVVGLTDGREAAIMELTSGGQSIRFLLPTETVSPGQAAYLDQALPTWLARYKGATAPAAGPVVIGPRSPGAAEAAPAAEAEIGVALPAPGPSEAVETSVEAAPSYATVAMTSAMAGSGGLVIDRSASSGQGNGFSGGPSEGSVPGLATGAATASALASDTGFAPSPAGVAPGFAPASAPSAVTPPPPPTFAPVSAGPGTTRPPIAEAPPVAPAPPANVWDDPPLGEAEEVVPAKKSRFGLSKRKSKAVEAATVAAAVVAGAPPTGPDGDTFGAEDEGNPPSGTSAGPPAGAQTGTVPPPSVAAASESGLPVAPDPGPARQVGVVEAGAPEPAPEGKSSRFPLSRSKARAAAAVAGTTTATDGVALDSLPAVDGPPLSPPSNPVPLAVQPPPPVMDADLTARVAPGVPVGPGAPVASGGDSTDGPTGDSPDGSTGVVLADSGRSSTRTSRIVLVLALVVVLLVGAGYLVTKKNSTTTAPSPAAVSPVASAAGDTALAGSINLRLSDLATGWTEVPPAQAVVRPPVAPAVAQADATNAMAGCLATSYSVVSGLFDSGSLPNQTSLVQSPMFQGAAGSSFEMASKTTVLASPGQALALEGVFANPKFDSCYQAYMGAQVAAAVPGSTVEVQAVTLNGPPGVRTHGMVSTYTIAGSGTEVVGDAYILGGRVVTVLQPSTNGPVIPTDVFTKAFAAVAGRVAASSGR
jgi:hypothetical protein